MTSNTGGDGDGAADADAGGEPRPAGLSSIAWTSENVTQLGWPARMNKNEPLFFTPPPAEALLASVARKSFLYTPLADHVGGGDDDGNGNANRSPPTQLKLTFKLRWTPTDGAIIRGGSNIGGGAAAAATNYTMDYVGMMPPRGLAAPGKTADPGFTSVSPLTGEILAVPAATGNYTMWLLLEDESDDAAALLSAYGLTAGQIPRPESNQLVVAQWDFEVTGTPTFKVTGADTTTAITATTAPAEESTDERSSSVGAIAGGAVGVVVFMAVLVFVAYRCGRKKDLEEVRRRAEPPSARNQRPGVPQPAYGQTTMQNPTFDAPAYVEIDEEPAYEPAVPGREIVYDQGRLAGARDHALRDKRVSQQLRNSHA